MEEEEEECYALDSYPLTGTVHVLFLTQYIKFVFELLMAQLLKTFLSFSLIPYPSIFFIYDPF